MTHRTIGHGVTIDVVTGDHGPIGVEYTHPTQTGSRCSGFVLFDLPAVLDEYRPDPSQVWHLEHFEPLTLSPSLLCRACGHHGFIRNGAWVPA